MEVAVRGQSEKPAATKGGSAAKESGDESPHSKRRRPLFSPGSPEIDRYLLFRDRLRADADARQAYEAVKRTLASQSWPDMNAYADAKTEIVERTIAAANAAHS